jgi:hypothetical protein
MHAQVMRCQLLPKVQAGAEAWRDRERRQERYSRGNRDMPENREGCKEAF